MKIKSLVSVSLVFTGALHANGIAHDKQVIQEKMQEITSNISIQKKENYEKFEEKKMNVFEWKNETIRIRIAADSVNRIILPAPITGKIYSQEKGIKIEISGNDAYIKVIPIKKVDLEDSKIVKQAITYDAVETEVFFTTEKKTYSFVFVPDKIEPRIAYITDDTLIKEDAQKLEKGSDEYVKNIKNIIRTAIDNKIDLSFTEVIKNEKHDNFYYVSRAEGIRYIVHKFFLKDSNDTDSISLITKSITSKIVASATYDNYYYVICENSKL